MSRFARSYAQIRRRAAWRTLLEGYTSISKLEPLRVLIETFMAARRLRVRGKRKEDEEGERRRRGGG
jgi:hypothetical protein